MSVAEVTAAEAEVRAFVQEFDTPNVRQALALCESGRVSWVEAYELLRRCLAEALVEVRS